MNCGHMLRKAGRFHADDLAVWMDGAELSYGEVYRRSCRLVNALHDLGLEIGDRVATLGPNTLWSLEEIAGLALGGCCRVPLHYRNTLELHRYMLELTGARVLVTDPIRYAEIKPHLDGLPDLEHVIVHESDGADGVLDYEELLRAASDEDRNANVTPDDLLHMAFTSGTTGRPKATVQTHGRWLRVTAENLVMIPKIDSTDKYLAAGPLSHAASTFIFAVIAAGAGVVVMPQYDAARAAELIEQHRITLTAIVPTMVQFLTQEPSARTRDLSSLRVIFASGSPITERTLRDAREVLGDVLYLGFGQSEGIPATCLTPAEIARGLDGEDPTMLKTAGRPVPSAMVKILDDNGVELPAGEIGEIAMDTPGNMKEFWRQPEETAKRFTPDGFILTRDIGYMDERGYLFLADRKEDMIISGGFNIWPAELENAIALHPAVKEVSVIGIAHERWGESPRAVVVLHSGQDATEEEIITWCRDRVGSMKKPTSVVFHEGPLPKSPTGKVLRRVLREEQGVSSGVTESV